MVLNRKERKRRTYGVLSDLRKTKKEIKHNNFKKLSEQAQEHVLRKKRVYQKLLKALNKDKNSN